MTLGLCQIDSQWENREATRDRITRLVSDATVHPDCLIFPEMTLSGFSMRSHHTTLDAHDQGFFAELASENDCTLIYGGVEAGYNCIFIARPGVRPRRVYQKRHLFTYGGEREHYQAGQTCASVDIQGARFALSVCYDLRFAYHFWEQAKMCDGYIVIANWPEMRKVHWNTLLRARAIENLAYIVGVNRVGSDSSLTYVGGSVVFDPFGESLLDCGGEEGIFICEVDPQKTLETRAKYRFIEDRQQ